MTKEPTPKGAQEAEEAIKRKAAELDKAAAKRTGEIHPERKEGEE